MKGPPKSQSPHQAGGLGGAEIGLRHSQHGLSIKENSKLQVLAGPTPATSAGLYLCRRFNINPAIADLVASLAGLGPDRKAA
jgi:hypothetical protein